MNGHCNLLTKYRKRQNYVVILLDAKNPVFLRVGGRFPSDNKYVGLAGRGYDVKLNQPKNPQPGNTAKTAKAANGYQLYSIVSALYFIRKGAYF